MNDYVFLSKDLDHWGEWYQSLWWCHSSCPLLEWFHVICITQMELVSPTCLMVWGDADKFHSDVVFLLALPKKGAAEERTYGLAMVRVHPYQARVSTIVEAIKQLDQLTPSRPNWPYALVWLNGNAGCMHLSTEGHLGVMMEGSTSSIPCGRICQLAVCQLLSSGSQVVYPEGLNGCQIPAGVIVQGHNHAGRQICSPTGWSFTIHHKRV